MPGVLLLGAYAVLAVGSFWGFAYKGMRESSEAADEAEARAWQLALSLAEHRKEYVILTLSDGGEASGFVVSVDDAAPVIFLDTRRIADDTVGLRPKGKFRGPKDIQAVDLSEVEEVAIYSGYGGDDDDDYEE